MRIENHLSMARWLAEDLVRRTGGTDMTAGVLFDLAHWVEHGRGRDGSVLRDVPVDRLVLLARRLALAGRDKPELAGIVSSLKSLTEILSYMHHISDHEVLPLVLRKGQKIHGPLDALGSPRAGFSLASYLGRATTRLAWFHGLFGRSF